MRIVNPCECFRRRSHEAVGPALKNAAQPGPLPSGTPLHLVVGLKMQNAGQVQPMLNRTIPSSLSGTVLAVLGLSNVVGFHSDMVK